MAKPGIKQPDIKVGQEALDSMSRFDVLDHVARLSADIIEQTRIIKAMISSAAEKDAHVITDSKVLNKFKPRSEYDMQLLRMQTDLMSIQEDIASQGVKMTQKDVQAQLKKMGM